jgi:hypothetical protein
VQVSVCVWVWVVGGCISAFDWGGRTLLIRSMHLALSSAMHTVVCIK